MKLTEDEIKEQARIYAELKPDFDMEDEMYYNTFAMQKYFAFIKGAEWAYNRIWENEMKENKRLAEILKKNAKT